jgi:hypothetical protein
MADDYETFRPNLSSPAARLVAVTPADEDIDVTRAIWVGGEGTLILTDAEGNSPVTITSASKQYHPIRAKRIAAASTATEIVALY